MNRSELEDNLRQTLDDHRLSRSEKRALGEVLADLTPTTRDAALLRSIAFDLAREELRGHENRNVLDWLEEIVKLLSQVAEPSDGKVAEAYFTPGADGPVRIASLVRSARRALDICVFTITDDRIARAVLEAHRRGVRVRIVTDDDKAFDRGSDIERLERAGIEVRTDRSEAHMHHKFALFDNRILLTGSYNWTRSAAGDNQENFVVIDDPNLVKAFARTFEQLWNQFE